MPRSNMGLSEETKFNKRMEALIKGGYGAMGYNQLQMGETIGKSQSQFSTQLKQGKFSPYELSLIFKKLEIGKDEIARLFYP